MTLSSHFERPVTVGFSSFHHCSMRQIWKYRRRIFAGLLVAVSSRTNAPPEDFEAMDDDASYAAVTMIQTNVRAHQIRKRKQKERDSDGSRDTPPTPGRGRAEVTPARTEELDGWKRRAARAIALVLALLFVYVYRPMLWAVNVPSSLFASIQRWILRPVARRLGYDLACCGGAVG